MWCNQIFSQISENVIKNIIVCDNFEMANYLARCTYGDVAFAVDTTLYPIRIGDTYDNGKFYRISEDGIKTEIPRNPTQEELITQLIAQMEPVRTLAVMQAKALPDEQALQVPELYDEWSGKGVSYTSGERVRYNGILYKVLQNHTSQEDWTPDTAHSLFAKVLNPNPEVIPNWEQPESTNGYAKGDKVKHKEKVWESLVDNNVWEPGAVGTESVWKEAEG